MHFSDVEGVWLAAGVHVLAHADVTLVLPAGRPHVHGANLGSTALEVLQQVAAGRQSSEGAASGSCSITTYGSLNSTAMSRCVWIGWGNY